MGVPSPEAMEGHWLSLVTLDIMKNGRDEKGGDHWGD